jgi:DeoR/GlpR family transcriptional regulator of sugar metabolism
MGVADQERQAGIVEYLQEVNKASVAELAKNFTASEATIRRDLTKLERQGHIFKIYGGARISKFELSYQERLSKHTTEKKRIGLYAANLVKPDSSILLHSGTTTQKIAENLKQHQNLTVVTSGISILQELATCENICVYLLGGHYRPQTQDLVGSILIDNLKHFAVDIAFLSVDGFDPAYGLSAIDPDQAVVIRDSIKIAKKKIVVADSSKGNRRSLAKICPIEEVDMLISDTGLHKDVVQELKKKGVAVELV